MMGSMIRFASWGRVSTEDRQDPESSRAWQRARATALIEPHGGQIVEEFRPWCTLEQAHEWDDEERDGDRREHRDRNRWSCARPSHHGKRNPNFRRVLCASFDIRNRTHAFAAAEFWLRFVSPTG